MSRNTILISMPVYNAEATLEKAIQSILNQKHKDFILNIVDDCSTDNSLKIAKSFASDPRVTVYKNKMNMGAYYSRNYGIYVSRNESWSHFTTHDADDMSFDNRYKLILKKMNNGSGIVAAQDTFDRINMATGQTLSSKLTMAHAVFAKKVFEDIGYFDNVRFGGDWEYWYRLQQFNLFTESGRYAINIKTVLGESYIHDKNLTVLIPEHSGKRHEYVKRASKKISRMRLPQHFYFDYEPEKGYTRRVS